MDIQNIHVMRASFQKLQQLCLKMKPSELFLYVIGVDQSA